MKSKALLTAVLLAATNFAWANGGITVDNFEQHMNAENWVATVTAPQKIIAQGPTDQFDVMAPNRDRTLVDTNNLKQSYDGQS